MNDLERRVERLFQNDALELPDFDRMWKSINPTGALKRRTIVRGSLHFVIASLLIAIIFFGWNTEQGIQIRQKLASFIIESNNTLGESIDAQAEKIVNQHVTRLKMEVQALKLQLEREIKSLDQQLSMIQVVKDLPTKKDYILLLSNYLPEGAYIQSYVHINDYLWYNEGRVNQYTSLFAAKYSRSSSEKLVQKLDEINVKKFEVANYEVYYLTDDNFHYLVWNQAIDGQLATYAVGTSLENGFTVDEMKKVVEAYID